ncbi:Cytochrome c oxidase subunit 5B, mitochondrial, partial [Acipenser ruthenus]
GIPTNEEQATGLELRALLAQKKGKDPYSIFRPKEYAGTSEDPHIVPSIGDKRLVGCLFLVKQDGTFSVERKRPNRCNPKLTRLLCNDAASETEAFVP